MSDAPNETDQTLNGQRLKWMFMGVGIAFVTIAALYLVLRGDEAPPPRLVLAEKYLLNMDTPLRMSLSPDGTRIAYVARAEDGMSRVRLYDIGSDKNLLLAGTNHATAVFWSPDATALAFANTHWLWRIDVKEGLLRKIAALPGGVVDGAWGPGDRIVMATTAGRLYLFDANGGQAKAIFPDQIKRLNPAFLPDGNRLAFVEYMANGPHMRWVAMDTQKQHTVAGGITRFSVDPSGAIVHVRNGQMVAQRFDLSSTNLVGRPAQLPSSFGDTPPVFNIGNGTMVFAPDRKPLDRLQGSDLAGTAGIDQYRFNDAADAALFSLPQDRSERILVKIVNPWRQLFDLPAGFRL